MPKVSVIMPVYNGAQYLQDSIDSILRQTYRDFEFIIINDGSSDNSAAIIEKNALKDSRIVSLSNERNSGICITLNKGLEAAQGEYIARMDCDDISLSNRLELQVEYMDGHPDISVSGSDLMIFGKDVVSFVFEFDKNPNMCFANMLFFTCMAHPTVIIRRNTLLKNNLYYDEHFKGVEDFHLWWRIAQHAKVSNIKKPLLNYRIHKNQVTQNFDSKHCDLQLEFLKIRLQNIGVSLSEDEIKPLINYILGKNNSFTDEDIIVFIVILKKILKHIKQNKPELYSPLRLVCGKAISQVVDSANELKYSNIYYMNSALINGCMSSIWYIKRILYLIKKLLLRTLYKTNDK